jgi:hypothetical protein
MPCSFAHPRQLFPTMFREIVTFGHVRAEIADGRTVIEPPKLVQKECEVRG